MNPEAFVELNQVTCKTFYANAPCRRFCGFRLVGVDGSTGVLPKHKSIVEEFGITNCGPNADSPKSMARMSLLYDVLNSTVLDAQIDKYDISERELARRHFDVVEPGKDLLLFDRGYPSLAFMFEMQARGIDYVIRMSDNWWTEVRKMMSDGVKDKEVTFTLPEKDNKLLKKYNTTEREIKCRLVAVELEGGGTEILCTSVTNKEVLPYECFAELYHYRWNVEEAYKLLKCRLTLEAFSGKTAIAVKQEFFAKVFTMTLTAVLAFPVDERLKAESSTRKHPHKVNRTNALAMVQEIAIPVFVHKIIRPALDAFDKILKATTELVRTKRKFVRKKLKKKPPSINYKRL